jgi:predicted RNase H-like HicB family nuclease
MAAPLSRSALRAREALVLQHLSLAVAERFRGVVPNARSAGRSPQAMPAGPGGRDLSSLGYPQQNGQTESTTMPTFSAVIERCPETGLLVGYVPGFPGAHSQGESLDELQANLEEVISMLLEDGEPTLESDFVGLQQISVAA